MKKLETDRELRDLIVTTLGEHKEHYILGSWEGFARRRARRRRLLFFFTGAGIAATFLAGWMGFRFFFSGVNGTGMNPAGDGQITGTNILPEDNDLKGNDLTVAVQSPGVAAEKVTTGQVKAEDVASYSPAESMVRDEKTAGTPSTISSLEGIPFQLNNQFLQAAEFKKQKTYGQNNTAVPFWPGIRELVAYDNSDNAVMVHPRRLKFGVSVSPGITSTATASSYNYSGGVSAEIELTRSISLSTGIQVEYQNVVSKSTDNPSWMPAGESRASLTALDMPLNLTWAFIDKRSSSYYISGGVSSIAWLGEKYTSTSYTQKLVMEVSEFAGEPKVTYNIENVKNTETETLDPLSSFSLAGRLNLMVGYENRMSPRFSLCLEPFLKIPVSGQAAEGLKYSISGITCRLSF